MCISRCPCHVHHVVSYCCSHSEEKPLDFERRALFSLRVRRRLLIITTTATGRGFHSNLQLLPLLFLLSNQFKSIHGLVS